MAVKELADAAQLASLADETPEGPKTDALRGRMRDGWRSIPVWAERYPFGQNGFEPRGRVLQGQDKGDRFIFRRLPSANELARARTLR